MRCCTIYRPRWPTLLATFIGLWFFSQELVFGQERLTDAPTGSPTTLQRASRRSHDGNSENQEAAPQRKFVRQWKVNDLRRDLQRLGEGRSYNRGKQLFVQATCLQCHRMNEKGGTLGPDLTGVAGRNSRTVILREIIEPSKKIPDQFVSHVILTDAGKTFQGIIVRQDTRFVYLADDPEKPDQLRKIPQDEIEEKILSPLSIMPKGLLDTLTKEEILDLLAYIESRGQEDHPAYDPL